MCTVNFRSEKAQLQRQLEEQKQMNGLEIMEEMKEQLAQERREKEEQVRIVG